MSPASRLLIEMAQEVREAPGFAIHTTDHYLMWSDHLTPDQYRKAIRYLVATRVVTLVFGDVLVWTHSSAKPREVQ